ARLAASALGAERVDEALLALLARTCEGNPLYVEELCAYLEERGRIELEDGQARLVSDDAPRLPEGLAALLASRIDALDPASKGALQVAAVIGTEVPLDLLTEVIGVDDATPLVEDLGAHSLLRPAEGGQVWGFPSELVRQAALRSVLGVQLRDYHRLVAAALERRVGREGAEWSDEELAEHCGRAGRAVDGARYAYTAAVRLERSRELESARRWYKRGLHWLEQASDDPATYEARIQGEALLRLRLGAVTLQLGEPRAGHAALRLALEVCEEAGLPWLEVRCHLELGRHHLGEGEAALARAHLGQARALARWEEDPALDAELAEAEARLAELEGTPEEARDAWSRALACAPDAPARTRCLLGQAMAMLRAGRVEEAEASLTRAHEEARSAADRLAEGEVLSQWGVLHLWRDEPEEAVRALRRALQLRLETGDRHGIVVDHHAIGDVHLLRGDLVRAALAFRRSRERAEAIGWRRGVVLNEVFLAFLEDPAPGSGRLERLEAATEDARRHGMPEVALSGEWLSGRLLAEAGRVEEARGRLTGARTRAERQRLAPLTRAIGHSLAELPDAHA
ncbi:MAG: tetratricopeptide repeat protein, partial [Myxococcales bacterium]|nr:tetratricopeptide repeat protein [Myxococcales bacterium]